MELKVITKITRENENLGYTKYTTDFYEGKHIMIDENLIAHIDNNDVDLNKSYTTCAITGDKITREPIEVYKTNNEGRTTEKIK